MRCFLRVVPLFGVVLFAGLTASARGDTISNFNLNATLYGGPVATGNFVVDASTGVFSSGEVTISFEGSSLQLSTVESQTTSNGNFQLVLGSAASPGDTFDLVLPVSSVAGYGGGTIASTGTGAAYPSLLDYEGYGDTVTSGALTLVQSSGSTSVAETPEMGSLVLVFTGLVAGILILRGRRVDASGVGAKEVARVLEEV